MGDAPKSPRGGILAGPVLTTDRLRLRPWKAEDLPAFAALNADPAVCEYLPKTLSRAESDALAQRISTHLEAEGFGLWAVEVPSVTPFAGFIGLSEPNFEAHFTPAVEVGWRLCRQCWGKGFATEGATRALRFAFGELRLAEVVSFTVPENHRSRRVMEKLGMHRAGVDDFRHPRLPASHPLSEHVLYRLSRDEFKPAP